VTTKNIFKKYIKKMLPLSSGKIINNSTGWILTKSNDIDYTFKQQLIEEVQKYCEDQGYSISKINKIIFASFYDLDINNEKIWENKNIKAESETQIDIIECNNKINVFVIFGQNFSITTKGEKNERERE